jgi:hypothetical protein
MALAQPVNRAEAFKQAVVRLGARRPVPVAPPVVAEGPAWQAFQLLHWAFALLPMMAGASKFFDVLGPWQTSVAPMFSDMLGISLRLVSYAVGAAEGVMGIIVAFNPRVGGWLVAGWLWGIVLTQLLGPGYMDMALRDAALGLGALALARLAVQFDHAIELPRVREPEAAPVTYSAPAERSRPSIAA